MVIWADSWVKEKFLLIFPNSCDTKIFIYLYGNMFAEYINKHDIRMKYI